MSSHTSLSDHCNSIPAPGVWSILSHCWTFWLIGSISRSQMFDVGNLPVLTFCNCVLKAEWLWNYTYVFAFFFKIQKNMTFYVFWSCCTIFIEHWTKRDQTRPFSMCVCITQNIFCRPKSKHNSSVLLYRLVVCVLLPYCHVLKQEMEFQWFHRVAAVDFL